MRNINIDVTRGALMLYIVVVIHGIYWLNLMPDPFKSLLLFEMPAIFMLSGYSYALFEKNTNFSLSPKHYVKFFFSRISRILIPYIPVAIASGIIYVLVNDIALNEFVSVLYSWVNPFTHGGKYSYGMLTWHLWFIQPFLIITLSLPFITIKSKFSFLYIFVVFYIIYLLSGSIEGMTTPIFYLIWGWLGYQLGNGFKLSRRSTFKILFISLSLLLISKIFFDVSLNMQSNKFPPNETFFIFSIIWISFLLLIMSYINLNKVEYLAQSKWLKPFIFYGYSIYLWQGIGYTLAKIISDKMHMPIYFQWIISIFITVFFGSIVFGFLENIRFKIKNNNS